MNYFSRANFFRLGSTLKRQRLHLFVRDIECDLFPVSEESKPSSYVCLVSSPEEILLWPPTRLQQCCSAMKKLFKVKKSSVDMDQPVQKATANGWPRTVVMNDTLNPKWGDDEIHCILRRHQDDGSPLNLSGAILHLFVFKHHPRQSDEVIGSFPINLEMLFRSVARCGGLTPVENKAVRGSMRGFRDGVFHDHEEIHKAYTNDDDIVSREIDGPILKNGYQMGVIRCKLDAWWVDEDFDNNDRCRKKPLELAENCSLDGSDDSQFFVNRTHHLHEQKDLNDFVRKSIIP